MQKLQFLYNISKRQWILLFCLMLIAYLARFALAQDTVTLEESVTPSAVPVVIEPVAQEAVLQPPEPTQVIDPVQIVEGPVGPEPTQSIEIIASPEPIVLVTILPDVEIYATPAAPIETITAPETLLPTVSTPVPESAGLILEPPIVDVATITPVVRIEIQPTTLPTEFIPFTEAIQEASPIVQVVDTTLLWSQLSGSIHASLVGINATVTIVGLDNQQTVLVQSDGSFALDVVPGDYQLIITAQSHLPYVVEVSVSDQALVLPTITLINNQMSGEIVRLIIQNFGMPIAPGLSAADVNDDGAINVYDLAIVGSSLR